MKKTIIILVLICSVITGCDKIKLHEARESDLELVEKFKLNLPEPSGLALSADHKNLWTVSDNNGNIYLLTLEGKIVKKLNYKGNDLEGIAVINENFLAVVEENPGEVIILDIEGKEQQKKKLKHKAAEGITYNKNNNRFYLVNEKSPTLLIELDENLEELNTIKLDFAKDLSGIFYEENENVFWILSHESNLLGKFDPEFNLVEKYKIPSKQAEGIAVDYQNKRIYIVSDADSELAVFKMK